MREFVAPTIGITTLNHESSMLEFSTLRIAKDPQHPRIARLFLNRPERPNGAIPGALSLRVTKRAR